MSSSQSPVLLEIEPRPRDLGSFTVGRLLPVAQRRQIGPFVFLDQMGPASFGPDQDFEVSAHPHIGLATVTYLWEGWILHKDSLGSRQVIHPGAVNLMTAGRGIAHVERNHAADRPQGSTRLYGFQFWTALPQALEESEPRFDHRPAEALPLLDGPGWRARLVIGEAWGARAPVPAASPTLLLDIEMDPDAELVLPPAEERGLFLVEGAARLEGRRWEPHRLLVLAPGTAPRLRADEPLRALLLGGAPLDGPRHMWWNFVSSSKERILAAQEDWRAGRFAPVPGESHRLPLPDGPPLR